MKYKVGDNIVNKRTRQVWTVTSINSDYLLSYTPHYRITVYDNRHLNSLTKSVKAVNAHAFYKLVEEPNSILKRLCE